MSAAAHPRACPAPAGGCAPQIPHGTEALILDFDGTLADTTPGHEHALRTALHPHGVELDAEWYCHHVGLSIHDLLTALPEGDRLPHGQIIQASRTHLLAHLHTIAPITCTLALLHAARRLGLPRAVASGASHLLVDPGINTLGLGEEFAAVVAREDAPRGKPAPDLYLEAARRLVIPPQRCLAVDDAPDGIASARAAGMRVLTLMGGHLTPVPNTPRRPPRTDRRQGG